MRCWAVHPQRPARTLPGCVPRLRDGRWCYASSGSAASTTARRRAVSSAWPGGCVRSTPYRGNAPALQAGSAGGQFLLEHHLRHRARPTTGRPAPVPRLPPSGARPRAEDPVPRRSGMPGLRGSSLNHLVGGLPTGTPTRSWPPWSGTTRRSMPTSVPDELSRIAWSPWWADPRRAPASAVPRSIRGLPVILRPAARPLAEQASRWAACPRTGPSVARRRASAHRSRATASRTRVDESPPPPRRWCRPAPGPRAPWDSSGPTLGSGRRRRPPLGC
jgi:hypothetical protein